MKCIFKKYDIHYEVTLVMRTLSKNIYILHISRERKKVISFYEGFNEEMCVFIQQHVPLLILSQIFIPFR